MKISVAICTFNGEKYLREQLESILKQSVPVQEIILCDDCSSDQTVALAESILSVSDVDYQIFVNRPGLGVSANFLKALNLCTGDYIFTCDQDDIWCLDKVEVFLKETVQFPADLYFSDGELVDEEGRSLNGSLWDAYFIDYSAISTQPLFPILLRKPLVTGAAMMVTKDLVQKVEQIPQGYLHDEWFSLVAALSDSIRPIHAPTFHYRQHGKNVIGAKKEGFFLRLKKWLDLFRSLEEHHALRNKKAEAAFSLAQGSGYEQDVTDALSFWRALSSLKSLRRFERVKKVIGLYRKGMYRRFYTGKRGALRDMVSCLFF